MIRYLTYSLVLIFVAACTVQPPAVHAPAAATTPALRIALLPITDVMPFYVAQAAGMFTAAGIAAEAVPVSSAAERGAVIQSGGADCELTDLHGVLLTNASTATPMSIIATARQATTTQPLFFLLGAPAAGHADVTELAGASIAISENTIIDYWNDRILQAAGVDTTHISRTSVPQLPVRFELLMNNQVDAAILPDPLASLAQLQGAPLLADDTLRPDIAVSVLACRRDFIAAQTGAVSAFLTGWDQAVTVLNTDPAAYRNVLIEQTRVPEPLQDRYRVPPFPAPQVPSVEQVADVAAWLVERGLIEAAPAYEDVVDTTFRR